MYVKKEGRRGLLNGYIPSERELGRTTAKTGKELNAPLHLAWPCGKTARCSKGKRERKMKCIHAILTGKRSHDRPKD